MSVDARLISYILEKLGDKLDVLHCADIYYYTGARCTKKSDLKKCIFCEKEFCFLHINGDVCSSCCWNTQKYFRCYTCCEVADLKKCNICYKKYCHTHIHECDCENNSCNSEYDGYCFGHYDPCKSVRHKCYNCLNYFCKYHFDRIVCDDCAKESSDEESSDEKSPLAETHNKIYKFKRVIINFIITKYTIKESCKSCGNTANATVSCEICECNFCCDFDIKRKICNNCDVLINERLSCSISVCDKIVIESNCCVCNDKYCEDHLTEHNSWKTNQEIILCYRCNTDCKGATCGYYNCSNSDVVNYCNKCKSWTCGSHWCSIDNECWDCCYC